MQRHTLLPQPQKKSIKAADANDPARRTICKVKQIFSICSFYADPLCSIRNALANIKWLVSMSNVISVTPRKLPGKLRRFSWEICWFILGSTTLNRSSCLAMEIRICDLFVCMSNAILWLCFCIEPIKSNSTIHVSVKQFDLQFISSATRNSLQPNVSGWYALMDLQHPLQLLLAGLNIIGFDLRAHTTFDS